MEGKYGNTYNTVANQGVFLKGVMTDNVAIEVTRDLDYLVNELNEEMLSLLTSNNKIPFTAQGLALVEGTGQAVINRMVSEGVLDPGDGDSIASPVFTVPAIGDVSSSDKTARTLSGCKVLGTYAGAIIKIEIDATINLI